MKPAEIRGDAPWWHADRGESAPPGWVLTAARVGGVDLERRTIAGLVVPWDTPARVNGAHDPVRFVRGSVLADPRARLLGHHDTGRPLGTPLPSPCRAHNRTDACGAWTNTSQGVRAEFLVARSRAGDEALAMAEDGILDGLSLGAEIQHADEDARGILIRAALVREVSLVTFPAWADARVGT